MEPTQPQHPSAAHLAVVRAAGGGPGAAPQPVAPTILVIGPDPELRLEMGRRLTAEGCRPVGEAGYGIDASSKAHSLNPMAIVIHIAQPFERALQTIESLMQTSPGAVAIGVSSLSDGDSVRRAMRAGLADYLIEPIAKDGLGRAVYSLVEQSQARASHVETPSEPATPAEAPLGGLTMVFGAKGGIGKTTIATNLAAALATFTSDRIGIVDLDYHFGDVATMLNLQPATHFQALIATLQDPSGTPSPLEEYMTLHYSGVMCLPTSSDPNDWAEPQAETIGRVLKQMRRTFDITVADAPGALNESVMEAMRQATMLLLVTSTDLASVKDAAYTLQLVKRWPEYEKRLRLVLNHTTDRDALSPKEIVEYLGIEIFTEIPYDRAIRYSTQFGDPVALAQPNSAVGSALRRMALKVAGLPERQAQRSRLRVFRRSA